MLNLEVKESLVQLEGVRFVDGNTIYWLAKISDVPVALCPRMTMKRVISEFGWFWEITNTGKEV